MTYHYINWRNNDAADKRLHALVGRPPQSDRQRQQTASPQVQEAPDNVVAVLGPTGHVQRVSLGPRRQRLRQREGFIVATTETSSGVSQALARRPEQRATRHSARPDVHAPALYELRVIVVQHRPDQDFRRLARC